MAYFVRDWTGTDLDRWELDTSGTWRRVFGGAFDALIVGNRGQAGNTADERCYLAESVAPSDSVEFQLDARWNNAGGTSRRFGHVLRSSYDGSSLYSVEVDSNFGTTQVRIRRRVAGVWTTISGWTDVSTLLTALALDAGVTFEARAVNTDADTVTVQLIQGANTLVKHDDTDAARIGSGRYYGVLIGPDCTGADISWDAMTVTDLASDNVTPPTGDTDEVDLYVDGVLLREADWQAQGISIGLLRQSFGIDDPFTLTDPNPWPNPVLDVGQWVEVAIGGKIVAAGKLQAAVDRMEPGEGHTYTCAGLAQLAQDVPVEHPSTESGTLVFNTGDPSHTDYDPALDGLTLKEVFVWLFDNHTDGPEGLRAKRCAPPTGDAYVDTDFDSLPTDVIPLLQVTGDFLRSVDSLLAFTNLTRFIDPETKLWRFRRRATAAKKDVDVGQAHVVGQIRTDTRKNRTAILIRGQRPQPVTVKLSPGVGNGLDQGWEPTLEDTYTTEKGYKNRDDNGTVDTTGTDMGQLTLDPIAAPEFAMVEFEWDGTRLEFTDGAEQGNAYLVDHNTASQIRLEETTWKNGGPANGDAFTLVGIGKEGGRDNGYTEVGRRWELQDANLQIAPDACLQLQVIAEGVLVDTPVYAQPAKVPGVDAVAIVGDLPAIGLINFSGPKQDPCEEGTEAAADVEFTAPVFTVSDPNVPTLRVPPNKGEYRGTAFTTDPAKWDGGGVPGPGDPGVERIYPMPIQRFDGSQVQIDAYTALADMALETIATLNRAMTLQLGVTMDTSYAGLDWRLTVSDSGGTTGEEAADDHLALAVEWDPMAKTTTLYSGSVSNGAFDVNAMRRVFASRNNLDALDRRKADLEALLACAANALNDAGRSSGLPPVQICAEQVTSGVTKEKRTVKEDLESVIKLSKGLNEIVALNKGYDTWVPGEGVDGPVIIERPDGTLFELLEDGSWKLFPGPIPPGYEPAAPAGDFPFETPEDLGGLEGRLRDRINALLDLLAINKGFGFFFDPFGNLFVTRISDGESFYWSEEDQAWKHDVDGDGEPDIGDPIVPNPFRDMEDLAGHEGAFRDAIEQLAANLGKTVDWENEDTGDPIVLVPEDPVPDNSPGPQPNYQGINPDGTYGPVPLQPGSTTPSNFLGQDFAQKLLDGLVPVDLASPAGPVFGGPGGTFWTPKPADPAKPYLTMQWHELVPAAGGAGTGYNGSDYDLGGSATQTLRSRVHKQFKVLNGPDVEPGADESGTTFPKEGATTATTERMSLPGGGDGYDHGDRIGVTMTVRGEGPTGGDSKLLVQAQVTPDGAPAPALVTVFDGLVDVQPNGTSTKVTFDVPETLEGMQGGNLQLVVGRNALDVGDVNPDGVNVLGLDVDVPVQGQLVIAETP